VSTVRLAVIKRFRLTVMNMVRPAVLTSAAM